MRDINRQPNVRKVEAVAQPDERQCDEMVCHKFLEILPRLLEQHDQYERLLCPVTRLQEIIGFEQGVVRAIRERLVHACGTEIPDRRMIHDVQTIWARDTKVDGRVGLFQEAILLCAPGDFEPPGDGSQDPLHDEFPSEREDDDVEGDECKVLGTFTIVEGSIRVGADGGGDEEVGRMERIGEEDGRG